MASSVKIKKLPSGSYNARVYDYTDADGKRHYQSITGASVREVEQAVKRFQVNKSDKAHTTLTVGEVMKRYIEDRRAVLSPSTLRGYIGILKNNFIELQQMPVERFTNENVQRAVSDMAKSHKPKTVANAYDLLVSAVRYLYPDKSIHAKLPQAVKTEIQIPTKDEVKQILREARGTRYEVPVMLAALCGMRSSEIIGLRWENVDIKNNTISVKEAVVRGEDNKYVRKGTKTKSGTRTIKPPHHIMDLLNEQYKPSGNVVDVTYASLYDYLWRVEEKLGIPKYSPHKLRHYCVSVMLALNIPKFYIVRYVGHESEKMVNDVYGHIMQDAKTRNEDILNDYYDDIL